MSDQPPRSRESRLQRPLALLGRYISLVHQRHNFYASISNNYLITLLPQELFNAIASFLNISDFASLAATNSAMLARVKAAWRTVPLSVWDAEPAEPADPGSGSGAGRYPNLTLLLEVLLRDEEKAVPEARKIARMVRGIGISAPACPRAAPEPSEPPLYQLYQLSPAGQRRLRGFASANSLLGIGKDESVQHLTVEGDRAYANVYTRAWDLLAVLVVLCPALRHLSVRIPDEGPEFREAGHSGMVDVLKRVRSQFDDSNKGPLAKLKRLYVEETPLARSRHLLTAPALEVAQFRDCESVDYRWPNACMHSWRFGEKWGQPRTYSASLVAEGREWYWGRDADKKIMRFLRRRDWSRDRRIVKTA